MRFRRPTALTQYQRAEALRRHDAGEAATEIARSFNIDRATLYRALAWREAAALTIPPRSASNLRVSFDALLRRARGRPICRSRG